METLCSVSTKLLVQDFEIFQAFFVESKVQVLLNISQINQCVLLTLNIEN
jgi:hypothetical protein